MKKPNLITIFWLLVLSFFLIVFSVFLMGIVDTHFPHFLICCSLFLILGLIFLWFVFKEKPEKKLKIFFLLTGFSAVGFFVFVILHNLLYGLGVLTKDTIAVIFYISEVLHVLFFLIGTIICPIGFIVGVIGSIIHLKKKKKEINNASDSSSRTEEI